MLRECLNFELVYKALICHVLEKDAIMLKMFWPWEQYRCSRHKPAENEINDIRHRRVFITFLLCLILLYSFIYTYPSLQIAYVDQIVFSDSFFQHACSNSWGLFFLCAATAAEYPAPSSYSLHNDLDDHLFTEWRQLGLPFSTTPSNFLLLTLPRIASRIPTVWLVLFRSVNANILTDTVVSVVSLIVASVLAYTWHLVILTEFII